MERLFITCNYSEINLSYFVKPTLQFNREKLMRKFCFIMATVLSIVTSSVFAEIIDCELNNWCPLARPTDAVAIKVYSSDKPPFVCTLMVNGFYDGSKLVMLEMSGRQGFDMRSVNLSAHQGGSMQAKINGKITDPHGDPIVFVQRLTDDSPTSTNEVAFVQCTNR